MGTSRVGTWCGWGQGCRERPCRGGVGACQELRGQRVEAQGRCPARQREAHCVRPRGPHPPSLPQAPWVAVTAVGSDRSSKHCCWTSPALSSDKEATKDELGELTARCGCPSVSRVFPVRGARDPSWLVGNHPSCWIETGRWGGQGAGGSLRLSSASHLTAEETEARSPKLQARTWSRPTDPKGRDPCSPVPPQPHNLTAGAPSLHAARTSPPTRAKGTG